MMSRRVKCVNFGLAIPLCKCLGINEQCALAYNTHTHTPYNQKEITRKKQNKNDNPLSSKGLNNKGPQNKQNKTHCMIITYAFLKNLIHTMRFTLILKHKISQISLKDRSF